MQIQVLLLFPLVTTVLSSCFTSDAKWMEGPPKVSQPSKTSPNQVLVDWSAIIKRSRCVDKYILWVWADGQEKAQGKKYVIPDKNTQTKVVDIEPCVYYNFRIELEEDDSSHKDLKPSDTARYNSAALPSFNSTDVHKYFRVGYMQDPINKQFDLSKASVKFDKSFLTFASCVKHLELTGKQIKPTTTKTATTTKTTTERTTTVPMSSLLVNWEPYGTGRKLGELGGAPSRDWRWDGVDHGSYNPGSGGHGGYNPGSGGHGGYNPGSGTHGAFNPGTTQRPSLTTKWGFNPSGRPPTERPGGGWSYPTTARPTITTTQKATATGSERPEYYNGYKPSFWGKPSMFSNHFLRVASRDPPKTAGPVRKSPPFNTDEVEIVIPVEPCKQYVFQMKIINPQNAEIGKVTDLKLKALSEIEDFIPPPMTSVVLVELQMGGKWLVKTQPTSPVPESCLPEYMETMDSYTHRLEIVANEQNSNNTAVRFVQSKAQQNVELTQADFLVQQKCLCAAPRLEMKMTPSDPTSIRPNPLAGIYLYEGIWEGKPYYKQDLEGRSTMEFHTNRTAVRQRRKRFIGRVDGGGTTTTRKPWNYGVAGYTTMRPIPGGQVYTSSWSSWSSWSSASSPPSSNTRSRSGSTSNVKTTSTSNVKTTINIPIQRVSTPPPPPVLIPRYIYWEPTNKQWLLAPEIGARTSGAELEGQLKSTLACPADGPQTWKATSTSRSGDGIGSVELVCAPTY